MHYNFIIKPNDFEGGIPMKKSRIATLLLSILLGCLLSGCAGLFKNESMDQEVTDLITALNADDADQIFQSMYPDTVTREEFDEGYETIRQFWEASDDYTFKLVSINTKRNLSNAGSSLVCQAHYYVYTQENSYLFSLTHLSDEGGTGLSYFNISASAEPVLISGGFTTAPENSVLQWGVLIFRILSWLFLIVTIVDILRKRPRLFGLWLAAVLAFVCFQAQISQDSFKAGAGVYFFAMSAFKIYSNGTRIIVLALPVGAAAYWCLRRKLLEKKNGFS